jgi:tetratricopeptide (TPR) repeat protein
MYLYTFFLEGKYDECLNEFNLFNDLVQFQYELKTNQKSYFDIMKLKGDILFKKGKFKEAIESYSNIINEFNSVEIDFNLGLCYLFENDKKKGMNLLEKSKEIYLERKENEKVNIINEIINKIY